jgi:hypothetical protein
MTRTEPLCVFEREVSRLKCVLYIRSEVKLDTFENFVLFRLFSALCRMLGSQVTKGPLIQKFCLQKNDILYALRICSVVSDYSDAPTTSSRKQLRFSTGPQTLQFPHPFSSHLSRQFL